MVPASSTTCAAGDDANQLVPESSLLLTALSILTVVRPQVAIVGCCMVECVIAKQIRFSGSACNLTTGIVLFRVVVCQSCGPPDITVLSLGLRGMVSRTMLIA
jgi:hypothetical protein